MDQVPLNQCILVASFWSYLPVNGANRPYRDSITDATNGVGQLLMTAVYREQWIFWAATNVFSIYLWWGESLQIQGKYFIYLINSLVGWYQWSKAAKKA